MPSSFSWAFSFVRQGVDPAACHPAMVIACRCSPIMPLRARAERLECPFLPGPPSPGVTHSPAASNSVAAYRPAFP